MGPFIKIKYKIELLIIISRIRHKKIMRKNSITIHVEKHLFFTIIMSFMSLSTVNFLENQKSKIISLNKKVIYRLEFHRI